MLKAKIVISEKKNSNFTKFKFFIKKLLNISRYNYKLSTKLKLDIKISMSKKNQS